MFHDDPLAFFVTWTVYGTHFQGDVRGWRRRRKGEQQAQPGLAEWQRMRLNHPFLLLKNTQRRAVEQECRRHCAHRNWKLWEVNARSNHIHAVVTATGQTGRIVRDQLKANATRSLREGWPEFRDRPVWTVGGDWECINGDDDLLAACEYVREAQDRKGLDA